MCSYSGPLLGFVLGVIASVLAALCWELFTRRRLYHVAKALAGVWTAPEMLDGRTVDRVNLMQHAWPTMMKAKSRRGSWSAASHILDISAADTSASGGVKRPHSGYLVIDRAAPWRATRIVFYADSDEVLEQHIIISLDSRTLHIPALPGSYNRHALCKVD